MEIPEPKVHRRDTIDWQWIRFSEGVRNWDTRGSRLGALQASNAAWRLYELTNWTLGFKLDSIHYRKLSGF